VGNKNDPRAHALFSEGVLVCRPGKILHFEKEGRYPLRKNLLFEFAALSVVRY